MYACSRAYETSTLYRDLKLRGSIIKDRQLITLPLEQIYRKVIRSVPLVLEGDNDILLPAS